MRTLFTAVLIVVGVSICSITAQEASARYPYGNYGYRNSYSRYNYNYNYRRSNPYMLDRATRIYDYRGRYRGKLSSNHYDPESISNPIGRFGNKYSTDSVNNPYNTNNY